MKQRTALFRLTAVVLAAATIISVSIFGRAVSAEAAENNPSTNGPENGMQASETIVGKWFKTGNKYETMDNIMADAPDRQNRWRISVFEVAPGKTYRCRLNTSGTSVPRHWVVFADNEGKVVALPYKTANIGEVTVDFIAPQGAQRIWILTYTEDPLSSDNPAIFELSESAGRRSGPSQDEMTEKDKGDDDKGLYILFDHEIYWQRTFLQGRMYYTNGAVDASKTSGCRSRMIQIYEPVCIEAPSGFKISVNEYDNPVSGSKLKFVRNHAVDTEGPVIIVPDSVPCYLMIGYTHGDGTDVAQEEIEALSNGISIKQIGETPQYAAPSMFPSWAITGCSWDAGSIYETNVGHVTHDGLSWADNVSRRNGMALRNYAIGGTSIRTWFNYDEERRAMNSFRQLLEDEPQPLYILTFGGVNDRDKEVGFAVNDDDYSALTPSAARYYVGTIDDIASRDDYHDYPCTFYGYYGRIIEMIQKHAPKSMIIITSPNTKPAGNAIDAALNTACITIATHYGLPYMDLREDPYYPIYIDDTVHDHPTAATYSGWALAFERMFGKCVERYGSYFAKWGGAVETVGVEWEKIELE